MENTNCRSLLAGTCLALLMAATNAPVSAQSLNIKAPAPLMPGENHGTIDNQVGSHYWAFQYVAGQANIVVRFTSMGIFGNPMPATIEVVLHNADGKVFGSRQLTSNGRVAETDWPGTFGGPGTAIVELRPPGSNLVRNGGDYTITVSGPAIKFSGTSAAGPEEIVGTADVFHADLQERAIGGVERGFAELLGVHFTEAFETRDLQAFFAGGADGGGEAAEVFEAGFVFAAAERVAAGFFAGALLRDEGFDRVAAD